jgi:hypothetical protein
VVLLVYIKRKFLLNVDKPNSNLTRISLQGSLHFVNAFENLLGNTTYEHRENNTICCPRTIVFCSAKLAIHNRAMLSVFEKL